MKKLILFAALLYGSLSLYSQTLYVKLKRPLEQSQGLLDKVNELFTVEFVKNEKTSELLNASIYKIHHSLTDVELKQLHQLLNEDNHVVYSSLQLNAPSPPNDIPPTTPDFIDDQTYLKSDPGVDAFYAWDQGADGSNVGVHLIEYGFNLEHEEFVTRNALIAAGMTVNNSATGLYTEHGTATVGVIYGGDNGYGIKGIAHNANGLTIYPEWQDTGWDRPQAVANAVNVASTGDVLVYEMQIWGPIDSLWVPAEYDPLIWDLTKSATNRGLIVVAAAGNGGMNLNLNEFSDYHARGDSGAIIVGASWPNTSHSTISAGNHGDRVNVNAWGLSVFSTGYDASIEIGNDFNQRYTSGYNGTSSATAISGGCVASLQSYYHSISGGQYLTAVEMRDLLIETGISQPADEPYPAGKFINLRAAIERLNVLSNDDESFGDRLIVYPNPTEDFVTVKNENLASGSLEVYDSLGKRLLSQTISQEETTLDLSSFHQGIYFVKIVSGSKSGIKRIVKN